MSAHRPSAPSAFPTSAAVRDHLREALRADLVGPFAPAGTVGEDGEPPVELLSLPPSRWYLTGYLAPSEDRDAGDPTDQDQLGGGDDEDDDTDGAPEPEPKKPIRYPASMGLSVLLPPATDVADTVTATVHWADYKREKAESAGGPVPEGPQPKPTSAAAAHRWRRIPREPVSVALPVDPELLAKGATVEGSNGLRVEGHLKAGNAPGLAPGTRALTVFVVNRRPPRDKARADEAFVFQVELEVRASCGFVARPNPRDETSGDWDARVSDLQFRKVHEYAVGHGVSAASEIAPDGQRVVRTCWLPEAEVKRVVTHEVDGVQTRMEELGALADGAAAESALSGIVATYRDWIGKKAKTDCGTARRNDTRDLLMKKAERAAERIAAGIALLGQDERVLEAFRLMNQAMALAARKRNPERYKEDVPRWRLFQLAFVLLNLPGIADDEHTDRETVELIFFPTGGGKTEAYLGVIAFTLLLRRLRGTDRPDRGLGVTAILRYTLRLLTLDQLGRAATLVCALEVLRKKRVKQLGGTRFAVGLWVGRTATANTLKEVSRRITEYKNATSTTAQSPFPLTHCPWCGEELKKSSFTLKPNKTNPEEVVVGCGRFTCEFATGKNDQGLPVLFVDEQIYRELPGFLIATVDKFALLPWRGETGMLFGRVHSWDGRRFYGPVDGAPAVGHERLPVGLQPPELVVQDEVHLISGPLGTMVGLYETALAHLCSWKKESGRRTVPKILASTATVRRAAHQMKSLFARNDVALFPPNGIDDNESFFATVDKKSAGRRYVGVASFGRPMKAVLLRTYVALMAAAQAAFDPKGEPRQPADPYMTLVGYFNSLRELGGMRRLVDDEVRFRSSQAEERRPLEWTGPHPWFANRPAQSEPLELTSRESMHRIKAAKRRLENAHTAEQHVDVLLASNMISVGVDIDRLGLMVVGGQPKTTSEYIQATSRVGRDPKRPGLVVTCLNLHKPRDRSHYEHFTAYHESFYRFVEANSLTPFSGPALERGLAGALVGMTRLDDQALTAPTAAQILALHRAIGDRAVEALARRAGDSQGLKGPAYDEVVKTLCGRGKSLLDAWETIMKVAAEEQAAERCYSPWDRGKKGKPLLHTVLDEHLDALSTDEARFAAPTSMRDVEPSVHFWLQKRRLGRTAAPKGNGVGGGEGHGA